MESADQGLLTGCISLDLPDTKGKTQEKYWKGKKGQFKKGGKTNG